MSDCVFVCFRNQEDGIQDSPVAREVLLLRGLQDSHRHQELHPQGAGDLLRRLLRGEVRYSLRQVQQGKKHINPNSGSLKRRTGIGIIIDLKQRNALYPEILYEILNPFTGSLQWGTRFGIKYYFLPLYRQLGIL